MSVVSRIGRRCAIKFGPFQRVIWKKEDFEQKCEVYGIDLMMTESQPRKYVCTYYLSREDERGEFTFVGQGFAPHLRADDSTPANEMSAWDQWNIKFDVGQVVRRLGCGNRELYVIEEVRFRYAGGMIGRNYKISKKEESKMPHRDTTIEQESLLQQSDLHL